MCLYNLTKFQANQLILTPITSIFREFLKLFTCIRNCPIQLDTKALALQYSYTPRRPSLWLSDSRTWNSYIKKINRTNLKSKNLIFKLYQILELDVTVLSDRQLSVRNGLAQIRIQVVYRGLDRHEKRVRVLFNLSMRLAEPGEGVARSLLLLARRYRRERVAERLVCRRQHEYWLYKALGVVDQALVEFRGSLELVKLL